MARQGAAVVAEEVRELAQRSAKAAKEIKLLIENSSSEVNQGVALVRESGEALKSIKTHILEIDAHVIGVALSAKEQATALAQVNAAINNMDQTTQQNAAMVEETTAAAVVMVKEASRLRDFVGGFPFADVSDAAVSPQIF